MNISSQQVFQPHHYQAFNPPKPDNDDDEIRQERIRVQDELLWIDNHLWPLIDAQGWDLHRHKQSQHYTSSFHHIWIESKTHEIDDHPGLTGHWTPIVRQINSMWLHYGKSPEQLNMFFNIPGLGFNRDITEYYNAFYVHTRLQIYINREIIRAWLLFTDKNAYDKPEFRKNLRDVSFQDKFWQRLKPLLGQDFIYEIDAEGNSPLELLKDIKRKDLIEFLRTDRNGIYSGIYKQYQPDDSRISRTNIIPEMLANFRLLYPLYDLMTYRPPINIPSKSASLVGLFGGNVKVNKIKKKE